jgi:hypothetical protein
VHGDKQSLCDAAEALSSIIAKNFPKMVSMLSGATSFASAIATAILDNDAFENKSKAVVGGKSDDNGKDHESNKGGVNVVKKRKLVFQRYKKKTVVGHES